MRRLVVASVAAAVIVAGVACDDDSSSEGPEASASASPGASPTELTPPSSPSSSGTPQAFTDEDDVLRVAIPDPSTLDPMRIQDPGSTLIARQLFEGLVRWDAAAGRVVPAAAGSWKVTKRGRVFTFKLRDGLTFHDGTPVTAADFAFALNRIADKKNASDLAYTLERVDGFTSYNQLGKGKKLKGLRIKDESTLVIELTEPFYDFPAVLTHPGLVPIQMKSVRDIDEFLSNPVGNGPFQMAQPWVPGEEVVLEAYEEFPDSPDLDGVRFIPFVDAAESWVSFENGDLEVAEVPVGQIKAAAEDYGESGYQPLLAGYYFGLNLEAKVLRNVRIRQAINFAIDRDAIAQGVYKGTMVLSRGIVPAGMPGFASDACDELCRHSPQRARGIVSRLKKKERRLELQYTKGQPHGRVAASVAADLEAAGFKVRVVPLGFAKYVRRLNAGDHEAFRLGWISEYPIPDTFLSSLFESDAPDNHFGLESKKIDELLRKAHATKDEATRLRLYRRAEKLILERVPLAPIGSFVTRWAAQQGVDGIVFDVMGGFDAGPISLSE
ncbi:MAG: ABC transporter substrate-binding protein [Actinomycetota bacterium]